MHKQLYVTASVLILAMFLLSACGAATPKETVPGATPTLADENDNETLQSAPTSNESDENESNVTTEDSERPTSTAIPPDSVEMLESYPSSPQVPAKELPEGYPAPPEPLPTSDPYPGGLIWVLHPVGVQCEEGTLPGYGDLKQVQATLTASGIAVKSIETTDLPVIAQCGGPTSTHYRAQIGAESLEAAVAMDWQPEN